MLKLGIFCVAIGVALAANSYVVVLPKVVRPGFNLNVGVNILRAESDVTVVASLVNSATKAPVGTVTATVKKETPKTLTISVPRSLPVSKYLVTVSGHGGLVFKNSTNVEFNSKGTAVFIQTDKAMYKPGQTVNFRAFSVYPDLKPYTGTFTVEIYDPNSNKIKQWIDLKDPSSVVTKKFTLSDQPVLGDWKIKVSANNQGEDKVFRVAEYVLPKFKVSVNLPAFGLTRDKRLTGSVEATYTYGKPVSGTAHIRIKDSRWYRPYKFTGSQPMAESDTSVVNGKGSFDFVWSDLQKTLGNTGRARLLTVEVNVTDSLTGSTMNGSSEIQYYTHGVKLEWLKSNPKNFKPGLEYTAYLKLSKPDGSLLDGLKKDVSIYTSVTYNLPDNSTTTPYPYYMPRTGTYKLPVQNVTVPDNGLVAAKIVTPDNATRLSLQAHYPDGQDAYVSIEKMYSPSDSYIQTFLKSSRLSAGQLAEFQLKSTSPLTTVVYQILSRGVIVTTGTVNGQNSKSVSFNVRVTSAMAPNARILLYFVREDGEIVTDSISFNVEGLFANQVSVHFNKAKAEPGQDVDVIVSADANSVVNLLAVDQSVILLKSGNDITPTQVKEAVGLFDTVKPNYPIFEPFLGGGMVREKRMIWWPYPYYYGGNDAEDIFRNAGVLVLTDALVFHHDEPVYFFPEMAMAGGMVPTGAIGAGNKGSSKLKEVSKIRQDFPETWLWTDTTIGIYTYNYADIYPEMAFGGMVNSGGIGAGNKGPAPPIWDFLESVKVVPGGQAQVVSKAGPGLKEVSRVRKVFPETWLWTSQNVGTNGTARISAVVPDTITSWVASAFAVNPVSGLGVAPSTAQIEAFRPFFVSLNLPYSVVRGEQVVLQAIVFNYLTVDLDVLVTLGESENYRNLVVDALGHTKVTTSAQTETIHLKAGQARSVYFPIIPAVLGSVDVLVKAQSSVAADAVKRQLLVEAEGVHHEFNIPVTVDLKNTNIFSKKVSINLPEGVVTGSEHARVTAIGDLLGPTISNLDSLLKMPYGCGEQNMLNFAPDIFVMKYLTATNNLWGGIKQKAIGFLEKGYQRELTYQHKDGSFSAFGDNDPSGSMWLTAFVVKSFHQAKSFIFIDDDTIKRAVDWMITRQNSDGSFPDPGRVIHKNMQGGSASGPALTSFVLIALMENNDLGDSTEQRIQTAAVKARGYLEAKLPTMTNEYSLAITTYALVLAQSTMAGTALHKLNARAINKDGTRHWEVREEIKKPSTSRWTPPNDAKARDVEVTSYGLLTYAERDQLNDGIQIMKWIVSQRNPSGGFKSTQDTVLALQALSEFAKLIYSPEFNIEVNLQAGELQKHITVNKDNSVLLQTIDLPNVPTVVDVHATGHGMALVEVSVSFNVEADLRTPSFEVRAQLLEETVNHLTVQTCTRSLVATTGMAVQEIGIPSGFEADVESIKKVKGMKRVETADRKVILYFDEFTTSPVCLSMTAQRTGLVAKSQPVPIRVYDYYSPEDQVTVFYQSQLLKRASVCDVCAECGCKTRK
ncbi:LOW QUALITY PROTEIN: CD109 antigen-like [Liolophura sinensis]|uniref:LOW QUALITY PROTEIN: CD109 antigen-like n=1 Tax=Liolophura sinensis TaxID=3198878 RepID=UPI0031598E4F